MLKSGLVRVKTGFYENGPSDRDPHPLNEFVLRPGCGMGSDGALPSIQPSGPDVRKPQPREINYGDIFKNKHIIQANSIIPGQNNKTEFNELANAGIKTKDIVDGNIGDPVKDEVKSVIEKPITEDEMYNRIVDMIINTSSSGRDSELEKRLRDAFSHLQINSGGSRMAIDPPQNGSGGYIMAQVVPQNGSDGSRMVIEPPQNGSGRLSVRDVIMTAIDVFSESDSRGSITRWISEIINDVTSESSRSIPMIESNGVRSPTQISDTPMQPSNGVRLITQISDIQRPASITELPDDTQSIRSRRSLATYGSTEYPVQPTPFTTAPTRPPLDDSERIQLREVLHSGNTEAINSTFQKFNDNRLDIREPLRRYGNDLATRFGYLLDTANNLSPAVVQTAQTIYDSLHNFIAVKNTKEVIDVLYDMHQSVLNLENNPVAEAVESNKGSSRGSGRRPLDIGKRKRPPSDTDGAREKSARIGGGPSSGSGRRPLDIGKRKRPPSDPDGAREKSARIGGGPSSGGRTSSGSGSGTSSLTSSGGGPSSGSSYRPPGAGKRKRGPSDTGEVRKSARIASRRNI